MAAANLDITRGVADRLPLFFGGVLLVSFLLLMMVFRSVVVPLKAVAMNLLASAAAFGVLTLTVSGGPSGRSGRDPGGDSGADPDPHRGVRNPVRALDGLRGVPAVAHQGRSTTGPATTRSPWPTAWPSRPAVITAGAAVMITVFLSFVLGQDVLGKMFGIGLAAAVFIDATLVRMVLVPATMELLGDRNWWLPAWLDRLLPIIRVEGHELPDTGPELPVGDTPGPVAAAGCRGLAEAVGVRRGVAALQADLVDPPAAELVTMREEPLGPGSSHRRDRRRPWPSTRRRRRDRTGRPRRRTASW
jgi:RND superfamily putative drug exporter